MVLIRMSARTQSRHAWLLKADRQQLVNFLQQNLIADVGLIVSPEPETFADLPVVHCRQAGDLLGQEKYCLFIDLHTTICVDAIAATVGLVVGGGHIVFCLPDDKHQDVHSSHLFSQRLMSYLTRPPVQSLSLTQAENTLFSPTVLPTNVEAFEYTRDQQQVITEICAMTELKTKQSRVVIADRGRGKSTSVGAVAATLMLKKKISIVITAPSFKSTAVAFEHARHLLKLNKSKPAYMQKAASQCRFIAPDELLQQQPQADLLIIDEAAAIPLAMLQQMSEGYQQTVFVSTIHGYEGTGRGFFIRFFKQLDKTLPGWKKIEMKQPVRWSENDSVEPWLFKWLCLDADIDTVDEQVSLSAVTIKKIEQHELAVDENSLRQLFALLAMAHYRTRPSDLQRLLDDAVEIRVAIYQQKIVAAIVSADEGRFDNTLATQVYRGERRPPGHLLAQTLSYHCGVEQAACHHLHRVMRIVVHPQYQSQGLGSMLINQLIESCRQRGVDVLGASFGYTKQLADFWQQNDFELIRLGFTREQSSGERAAVFVRALNQAGETLVKKARRRFENHFPCLLKNVLSDIDLDINNSAGSNNQAMTDDEQEDIDAYVNSDRQYEICIGGVNKWLRCHQSQWQQLDQCQQALLDQVVHHHCDWKQVAQLLNLQGKKQAQADFKQAVKALWQLVNCQ